MVDLPPTPLPKFAVFHKIFAGFSGVALRQLQSGLQMPAFPLAAGMDLEPEAGIAGSCKRAIHCALFTVACTGGCASLYPAGMSKCDGSTGADEKFEVVICVSIRIEFAACAWAAF